MTETLMKHNVETTWSPKSLKPMHRVVVTLAYTGFPTDYIEDVSGYTPKHIRRILNSDAARHYALELARLVASGQRKALVAIKEAWRDTISEITNA